jgi:hypothetical protein
MKVAFGMKAHSGWAFLVVLGARSGELQSSTLNQAEARDLVRWGQDSARRIAVREMRVAVTSAAAFLDAVVDPGLCDHRPRGPRFHDGSS